MRVFQLTVFLRDLRTNARGETSFLRSPVILGRQAWCGIRLDAQSVSRQHGELRFGNGGLEYIDLNSTNGTYVDGTAIDPGVAVDVRESTVVDVFPFQMT